MPAKPYQFDIRIVKFLIVGVINTIFGYTIYVASLWIGLHYTAAVAASTILGTLFNFKSIGAFVFESRNNALLLRFIAVYLFLYLLNISGVSLLVHFDVPAWFAGLLLLLPLAILSFLLNRRYVFSP
ncbi:GtrA family protein [Agrobacterium pusense]|uniref:GtrA family protein n=1 Tax=Agrobacterium pusense TaxID=648995 RepID=UPI001C6E8FA1|nr:GtrA family protein [Agrobacterium pusense]MBW9069463.1 GtrA family protein [Agrobacterium pusense]MBW9084720.1 GtrA family protein [Agrobacterium pusense]MBW9124432.1 GtrA family protein [Agrobacterium pusense]MBW9137618.1 GtrA family protein [Agrobacterium pusense]